MFVNDGDLYNQTDVCFSINSHNTDALAYSWYEQPCINACHVSSIILKIFWTLSCTILIATWWDISQIIEMRQKVCELAEEKNKTF